MRPLTWSGRLCGRLFRQLLRPWFQFGIHELVKLRQKFGVVLRKEPYNANVIQQFPQVSISQIQIILAINLANGRQGIATTIRGIVEAIR